MHVCVSACRETAGLVAAYLCVSFMEIARLVAAYLCGLRAERLQDL